MILHTYPNDLSAGVKFEDGDHSLFYLNVRTYVVSEGERQEREIQHSPAPAPAPPKSRANICVFGHWAGAFSVFLCRKRTTQRHTPQSLL
eukprot:7700765-Ditylum_brightwellii.AAC.1